MVVLNGVLKRLGARFARNNGWICFVWAIALIVGASSYVLSTTRPDGDMANQYAIEKALCAVSPHSDLGAKITKDYGEDLVAFQVCPPPPLKVTTQISPGNLARTEQ